MKEEIEEKSGFWFINDNKYFGKIVYSQENGIYLTLFSDQLKFTIEGDREFIPVICGVVEGGKPITLYRNLQLQSNFSSTFVAENSSTFLSQVTYRSNMLFEGVFFDNEEEMKFDALYGQFTDLNEWLDISGFDFNSDFDEEKQYDCIVKYIKPENEVFSINSELNVGIAFSRQGPRRFLAQNNVEVTQQAFLFISSENQSMDFHELFSYLNWFSMFLELASQRKVYPIEIEGLIKEKDKNTPRKNNRVRIFFQPLEPIKDLRKHLPADFLFNFADVHDEMIRNWFNHFQDWKTIVNLRNSLFLSERLFLETKFINIVQALESFHSMNYGGRCFDKDEFKEIRTQMLSPLSDEYRKFIEPRIGNLNYLSFRDRLLELFQDKVELFSNIISEFEIFVKRVALTRNEFVHSSRKCDSFSKNEIFYATVILTYLFEACLFEKIGFSSDKIQTIYNKRIKQYLSWGKIFVKKN